jgi:hypothetical protein
MNLLQELLPITILRTDARETRNVVLVILIGQSMRHDFNGWGMMHAKAASHQHLGYTPRHTKFLMHTAGFSNLIVTT